MSFESLILKVQQAESALEEKERQTGENWRHLKITWKTAWTPGRIISIGLVSGFLVGRAEPAKRLMRGGGALQMLSSLAGLFAGGSAQAAAAHAEQAATAASASPPVAPPLGHSVTPSAPLSHTPESLRAAGML
jgi:hypothetical protein